VITAPPCVECVQHGYDTAIMLMHPDGASPKNDVILATPHPTPHRRPASHAETTVVPPHPAFLTKLEAGVKDAAGGGAFTPSWFAPPEQPRPRVT